MTVWKFILNAYTVVSGHLFYSTSMWGGGENLDHTLEVLKKLRQMEPKQENNVLGITWYLAPSWTWFGW